MASYFDTSGNDRIFGTDGDDTIHAATGGDDIVHAGAGNDEIDLGSDFNIYDRIDGGGGSDRVRLSGDYGNLDLQADTLKNVEWLEFTTGNNYSIFTNDKNVAAHQQLSVDTLFLSASDQIYFNGSAEQDGYFGFYIGSAASTLIGGAGDDTFTIENLAAPASTFDVLDGRGGYNVLTLYGGEHSVFDFAGNHIMNMQEIDVFGADVSLTLTDDVVNWGVMKIETGGFSALSFDGSAERESAFLINGGDLDDVLQGGRQADTIAGGDGDDRIVGHGGADDLSGGNGADTFTYDRTGDSLVRNPDVIHDLGADDVIDLSAIDANRHKVGDQAFHLVTKFDHHAGEATLQYDPVSGRTELSLDVNGDGRADAMILIDGDHRDFSNFVL